MDSHQKKPAPSRKDVTPYILYKLKFIGKIALIAQGITAVALIAMVLVITGDPGTSYGGLIMASSLASENLMLATVLSALVIAAVTAGGTWLVAVYSTFRVAGPLYRFSLNIEAGCRGESVPTVSLRQGDRLLREARLLNETAKSLSEFHAQVSRCCDEFEDAVVDKGGSSPAARNAFENLKKAVLRARV